MSEVRANSFTSLSPEDKAKRSRDLRHGNPNWPGRGGNPKGSRKGDRENRKLFSDVLRQIYSGKGGPKKLKKLAMVCIEYAEAGHARFAELILDRLEGPVKHDPSPVTNNFIFSDADRERAESIVDDIMAMDARTITLPQLPEETHGTATIVGSSDTSSEAEDGEGISAT